MPPPVLAEAMMIDVTRKVSLWEYANTDAAWHRSLMLAWNAYAEERSAAARDAEKVAEQKRGAASRG